MGTPYPTGGEFYKLSEDERKRRWSEFLSSIRCNANSPELRIEQLRAQIAYFEQKYKLSTQAMQEQLCQGKLPEEGEIAEWDMAQRLLLAHGG